MSAETDRAAAIIADLFSSTVGQKLRCGYNNLYVWEREALDWLREWRANGGDTPINLWTASYLKYGPPPWRKDQM